MRRLSVGLRTIALVAAIGCLGARPAQAAAFNLTSPGIEYGSGLYTLGFEFTVNTILKVTSLGVYDSGSNGLENPAQVALWLGAGGAPLASAVVPGGAGGTLNNMFRYVDIAPIFLVPGQTYVIGSYLRDGVATSLNTGQGGTGTIDPLINVVMDRFSPFDNAFGFPTATNFFPQGGWLGANFQSQVPEPATLSLVGLGLAGLYRARRRSR